MIAASITASSNHMIFWIISMWVFRRLAVNWAQSHIGHATAQIPVWCLPTSSLNRELRFQKLLWPFDMFFGSCRSSSNAEIWSSIWSQRVQNSLQRLFVNSRRKRWWNVLWVEPEHALDSPCKQQHQIPMECALRCFMGSTRSLTAWG